jgi:hypothetical protein
MINPDCPHVVPSLDHKEGFYCPRCNGGPCQGNCHNKGQNDETQIEIDLQPQKFQDQVNLASSELSHDDLQPGAVFWFRQELYGQTVWTEATIIADTSCDGWFLADWVGFLASGTRVSGQTIASDWFLAHSQKQRPKSVSDSGENQGFQGFDPEDYEAILKNRSDSGKARGSGDLWREARPYKSKGTLYFRYRWGHGSKIEGVKHIPGSNLASPLGRKRAAAVAKALYWDGWSHAEILKMIGSWSRR